KRASFKFVSKIVASLASNEIFPSRTDRSESLLQLKVPEPALDRGKRLVITVLEAAGHERWIFVEHILQPKRKSRVVQPGAPSTRVVFRCRNRHDIFLFAVFHLHILAAVLRKARHL